MDQEGQHTPVQVVHVMKVPEVLNILDPEVMLMTAPVVPGTPGQEAPLTMALVERHMVAQAAPATLEQEGRATPGLVVQEKIAQRMSLKASTHNAVCERKKISAVPASI